MRLDAATIAIEPRSVGSCIDLAILFYRVHFWKILALTAFFAVPTCLFNHWSLATHGGNLFITVGLFYWISPFLSSVLVTAAGQQVFGDPFVIRRALRAFAGRSLFLVLGILGSRLAILFFSAFFIVPSLIMAARCGFFTETLLLEQVEMRRVEKRVAELVRGALSELTIRLSVILFFFCGVVFILFILADLACGILFGFPLFVGRFSGGAVDSVVDELGFLLFEDPRTLTALLATLWLAYPLACLAWFFCYIDIRIRKELWDLELDFRIEAQRLTSTPSSTP